MQVIAHAAAAMSAVILIAMIGLILVEIAMRNLLGLSLGWAGELVGYGVAAITFNALAYTMQRNALIRVSLVAGVAGRIPRLGRILDLTTLTVTLLAVGLAWTFFLDSILRHWARGSVSATRAEVPLWIAEGFVLLGLTLFGLQLLVSLANFMVGNKELASAGLLVRDETWGNRAADVKE
jgi:TRAP-type mannitol/chloroaromatic compound transport system permease small subunit